MNPGAALALLKRPKILAIGVLSVGFLSYYAYSEVKQARLESRVSELEGEVTRKDSQISSLTSSVDRQNELVDQWRAKAQERAQAFHEAAREAQKAKQAADEAVGRLQASEAMTCQEGIDLIDEALGL